MFGVQASHTGRTHDQFHRHRYRLKIRRIRPFIDPSLFYWSSGVYERGQLLYFAQHASWEAARDHVSMALEHGVFLGYPTTAGTLLVHAADLADGPIGMLP